MFQPNFVTFTNIDIVARKPMGGEYVGNQNDGMNFVHFADGSSGVEKNMKDWHGNKTGRLYPAELLAAQEYLSARVGQAMNAPVRDCLFTNPDATAVIMPYIDGQTGLECGKDECYPNNAQGGNLRLFDYLTANADRRPKNLMWTPDGRIVGIDHALCNFRPRTLSPELVSDLWNHGLTLEALEILRPKLERLQPHFAQVGFVQQHQNMIDNLDKLITAFQILTDSVVKKGDVDGHPFHGNQYVKEMPSGCTWSTPDGFTFLGAEKTDSENQLIYETPKGNRIYIPWSSALDSDPNAWKPSDERIGYLTKSLDTLNQSGGLSIHCLSPDTRGPQNPNTKGDGTASLERYLSNETKQNRFGDFYITLADKKTYLKAEQRDISASQGGASPNDFGHNSEIREYGINHWIVSNISSNPQEVAQNLIAHEMGHYEFERDIQATYKKGEGFHFSSENLYKLIPVMTKMAQAAISGLRQRGQEPDIDEENGFSVYKKMTDPSYWENRFAKEQKTESGYFGTGIWNYGGGFNPNERSMLKDAGMTEYGVTNPAEFIAETYAMSTNPQIVGSSDQPVAITAMKDAFPRWAGAPVFPITKMFVQKGDTDGHPFHGNQYEQVGGVDVAKIQKRLSKAANKLTKEAFAQEAERPDRMEDRQKSLELLGYKSLEEYQNVSAKAIKDFVAKNDIAVSVITPSKNLLAILNSGEIQNGYVSRTSLRPYAQHPSFGTSGDLRIKMENKAFGLTNKSPLTERPVYGFVDSPGLEDDPKEFYGSAKIVLKPDVKERSTVTVGDSMDTYKDDWGVAFRFTTSPILASNPNPKDIFYPSLKSVANGGLESVSIAQLLNNQEKLDINGANYVEAQIHGGLKLENIARIDFYGTPSPELETALKEKGIPYNSEITKGDTAGHEFHGNQWTSTGATTNRWGTEHYADLTTSDGTVLHATAMPHVDGGTFTEVSGEKNGYTLRHTNTDVGYGQADYLVTAHDKDGNPVGFLSYAVADGDKTPHIQMVETSPEARGQGLATAMFHVMMANNPKATPNSGMLTDDGAKWWNSPQMAQARQEAKAITEYKPISKGDVSGHSFHGNQYVKLDSWENPEHAKDWLAKNATGNLRISEYLADEEGKGLTPEQEAEIRHYTQTQDFFTINNTLRNGVKTSYPENDKYVLQDIKRQASVIQSAIDANTITKNLMVYRGLRTEKPLNLKTGDIIGDKAFTSTSVTQKEAERFGDPVPSKPNSYIFNIKLPAGTNAVVCPWGEFEVLLGQNSSFSIDHVDGGTPNKNGTTYQVDATYIGNGKFHEK
jgi:hypothetical protein